MSKVDLKKTFKNLYNAKPGQILEVDVPEIAFIMVEGKGDPNNSPQFQEAIEVLYGLSYTLKFMAKFGAEAVDYVVMPLEALWWAEDMSVFDTGVKYDWLWTLMIMQPDLVTDEMFREGINQFRRKKGKTVPASLDSVRFERFREGLSAQTMHIGPSSAEKATIAALHDYIREQGRSPRGKHHEIYLSNPQRVAPEKMRTLIRQPMK